MYEFSANISVSRMNRLAEVQKLSEEPYNECQDLKSQIKGYKSRYGHYPKVMCADKIYL